MATLGPKKIQPILEAALQAADEPLTVDRLYKLFEPGELPEEGAKALLRDVLKKLGKQCEGRGIELKKVGSGYRLQVRQDYSKWVSRLWEEKPPRYTRALLETLSLIAYKQPVTRGDIEEVRGVTVSTNIMRTLVERGWIREVGQREVPGRPSMYGTTKAFLDYFNLSSLDQLPTLAEVRALVEPVVVEETPTGDEADAEHTARVLNADPDAVPVESAEENASADVAVEVAVEVEVDEAAEADEAEAAQADPSVQVSMPNDSAADTGPDAEGDPKTEFAPSAGASQSAAAADPEVAVSDELGPPVITITEPQSSAEVVELPGAERD